MGSKRGSAVLEAPEDDSTSEMELPDRRPARRTASRPLQDEVDDRDTYEEPAFRRQPGGFRLRMRPGLP
ncbi:MAG TPA: hypothetical protein VM865_09950, partial [Acidobacteriaceae bacterium]|nr:hypothetical protein [Acidobacteriaceae bacterium]